jgi:Ran GTPase-activating protein (RanGAP) involved in mRNA processing and transport
MSRKK